MLKIQQSCGHLDEAGLQKLVVSLLRELGLFFFHTPNGAKRSFASANFMRQMGMVAGIPDLIIISRTDYMRTNNITGVAIELKKKPNKLSAHQRDVIDIFRHNKWRADVCYTFADVVDVLHGCGYSVSNVDSVGDGVPPA